SGGVGLAERESIEALAESESLNLKLVFAEPDGPYVSGVRVAVRNANGEAVLEAVTNGPWLLARLPAGAYRVQAELRSVVRETTVNVPETGRAQLVIAFPAPAAAADS
ncbi:MAG TPA: hypothetical protein VNZ57_16250, partial [Longimicrobiales bacterium]|nr:hypothetical protein [Longimicrobiales bacterium]